MTNYEKLEKVLTELFQLDKAELDFGIYRIMNQKRDDVLDFLSNKLPKEVRTILESQQKGDASSLKKELDDAIKMAKEFDLDPNTTPKVLAAKAAYESAGSIEGLEQEVFSHLASFFKRYYEGGDFVSLRRYKKDVYAIPYEGEEVKLHWANHDQYYIKTSENLKNYAFKIDGDKTVKFTLKEANTEQNNNKTQKDQERRFALYEEEPVTLDGKTIHLNFTYEPYKKSVKQDKLLESAVAQLTEKVPADFTKIFSLSPTEKNKKRTLLEKHLNDFSARNTFDYFIHKDLGGFLTRELDFYIKNEVLFIDDINTDNEQAFTTQLSKIRALKQVASKIITFLAQLENFQKKLWLKKKFVVNSDYCITLDRIPESYYAEIASNKEQLEEWKVLFDVDIKTEEDLNQEPYLVLDTKFFSLEFNDKLLAEFDDLDEQTNGLMINSENFQALKLLTSTYQKSLSLAYLDPPYNTDATPIIYKNSYKDSSWMSLIADRVKLATQLLLPETGVLSAAIDDIELSNLSKLLEGIMPEYDQKRVIVQHYPGSGTGRSNITRTHEYNLFMIPNGEDIIRGNITRDGFRERGFRRAGTGENNYRIGRPNSFFALIVDNHNQNEDGTYPIVGIEKPPVNNDYPKGNTSEGYQRIYPIGNDESERVWSLSYEGAKEALANEMLKCSSNFSIIRVYFDEKARSLLDSVWTNSKFSATSNGTNLLKDIFNDSSLFSYPKSLYTMTTVVDSVTHDNSKSIILDFFAGSASTGHAIIKLNRQEKTNRKYVLVEMGEYFNSVTKPRIQKVIYTDNWKNGNPQDKEGISQMFKYFNLESYEDALNNLQLKPNQDQQQLLDTSSDMREEYLLQYMLEVESREHLMNIKAFVNPFNYKLNITENNELIPTNVNLVETFNYLIGLKVKRVQRIGAFKTIEGVTNAGDKVLVIWRNLEESNNEDLNAFVKKMDYNLRDGEFDTVYVNGDNNLANLKQEDENWKVLLLEEVFFTLMFDVKDV